MSLHTHALFMTDSEWNPDHPHNAKEWRRLEEDRERIKNWKRWGPYISERQWATVREDYSYNGDPWNFLSHDMSRSYAYRWGEDGILGITDRQCRLCFALCMWNERDPILKERLFGVTGPEGNHGEDVKEHYFYIESSPTHSYMKGLYKYPFNAFPYTELVNANRSRSREELEFEILDTGVFNHGKYWDIYAEYAKENHNDILIKLTVANRSTEEATLHLLPTLWYRNVWSFHSESESSVSRKSINIDPHHPEKLRTCGKEATFGDFSFECDAFLPKTNDMSQSDSRNFFKQDPQWIFTENETNIQRLYNSQNRGPYVKDAFHEYVIHRKHEAINPAKTGSKSAAHIVLCVPAKTSAVVKLRLYSDEEKPSQTFGQSFDKIFSARKEEHDHYYNDILPKELTAEERSVCMQAFAGLLWSKQYYHYVIKEWLEGDVGMPPPPESRKCGRNHHWNHLFNRDVISMPDKWEYPWYAVWDTAFHMVAFSLFDIDFAKEQLLMLLREWYMHPNGCLPAYEFNFSDVNPPVHAWSCWRVYKRSGPVGKRDTNFLSRVFQKLIVNFTWWVNRKDPDGNNLFSGGFLGLDNIGVFDRSQPLPTGGQLQQADGTSWMAFYCIYMLKISIELSIHCDESYADMASKFFEHFVLIADAMNAMTEGQGMWDQQDKFYYDQIVYDKRSVVPLKVRSVVGLAPLMASGIIPKSQMDHPRLAGFKKRTLWFLEHRKDLGRQIELLSTQTCDMKENTEKLYLLSIPKKERLQSMLRYLYNEKEFLSDFGIRSLSKFHKDHPYVFWHDSVPHRVDYQPAESTSSLFGGNSNWRGPIWMPMNILLAESLRRMDNFYKTDMSMDYPTGSGRLMRPGVAAINIYERISTLFLPDKNGRRPCHGSNEIFQTDEHWKDLIYFYEYFDGDTGRGLGASHQTGWTALVANCLYDIGHQREKIKQKYLKAPGQEFLSKNIVTFSREVWSNLPKQPYDLQVLMVKEGFKSLADMMECYFHKCKWLYNSLLLKCAISNFV